MTEDWELNFRVQTCDNCNELYCEEDGLTKEVITGFNTKRTYHFCGTACHQAYYLKLLRDAGL